jgi:POT family proton-dependent oligopeptide transporter
LGRSIHHRRNRNVFRVNYFSFGLKHVKKASEMKPAEKGDTKISDVLVKVFLPAIIAGAIGWVVPTLILGKTIFGSTNTDAFIFACVPVIYFYASLYFKANSEEKDQLERCFLSFW